MAGQDFVLDEYQLDEDLAHWEGLVEVAPERQEPSHPRRTGADGRWRFWAKEEHLDCQPSRANRQFLKHRAAVRTLRKER